MDDQMTEDILKRSKARFEEFERMVNSPSSVDDNGDSFNSSAEYGIETFKNKSVPSPKKPSVLSKNEDIENCPPTPVKETFLSTPQTTEKDLSNILVNGASVKALRNRWEEIARSESSPLTTSFGKNLSVNKFVSPATTIDQAFAFIGQNHDYSASPPAKLSSFETYDNEIRRGKDCSDNNNGNNNNNRKNIESLAAGIKNSALTPNKSSLDLTPTIISPKTVAAPEPPPPPPHLNLNYRPITPNSEVLGSLLDDINNDLEKYKNFNYGKGRDESDNVINELHHTISFYRRQGRDRRAELPVTELGLPKVSMEASTSHSLNSSSASSDMANTDATLKRLHEQMIVQQDQICQASRALSYCRQTEHFRGSREEIDAQRALLIATERRRTYCIERDRVINARQGMVDLNSNEPRGTLTFSYIAVRLSRDFVNMCMQQYSEHQKYHFIVLIRCGEHVLHTSLSDTDQNTKSGFVEFTHFIQLSGLTCDFICTVEVHGLRAAGMNTISESKSKRRTIKKIVGSSFGTLSGDSNTLSSIGGPRGGPVGIIDPGFQKLGHVTLNRSSLDRERFLMSEVLYPLDGNIVLKMHCFGEQTDSIDFRGFLSLYQIVSGLGSWTRFWCVLGLGQMRFWRYPEDEERKIPSVALDLSKCLTNVSEVPSSVASFPHSMQVDVAISVGNNPIEEIRMLFAADTTEEMELWMEAMNKAIRFTNIWNHHPPATASCSTTSSSSGVSSSATKTRF